MPLRTAGYRWQVTAHSAARSRDPWFDNAKMALVTLVVVGHAWTLLPDATDMHAYDFLYTWHMPAFVIITGYLSRTWSYTPVRVWQLVRTVAVPYVVFECALALFRVYVGGERLEDLFADPHWPMWFLAALFFWRLLTPVFRPLPLGIVVAIAVSLIAGLYAGDTLDAARVLGLLPFFVLGLKATPEWFAALRRPSVRVAGVAVLAGIWVLTAYTDRLARTEWLYYRTRYTELDVSDLHAFAIRAVLLTVGVLGACAFFSWVPGRTLGRGGWFTRMGEQTLVVYLFHGFAVLGARFAGYESWTAAHPVAGFVVTTIAGVALTLLLAARPVARVLGHAVDPLGYGERRMKHAVEVTVVADRVESEDLDHAGEPVRPTESGERTPHRRVARLP